MNELGERIQTLRKQAGMTQYELAKKTGISHTQMARYETKGVQPPADVLKRFAGIFDTSIDYLVNGDKSDKARKSLKDAELVKQFKQIDLLPDEEKHTVLKVIDALLRDYKARQTYAI